MLNFANILTMSRIAAIPAIVGLLLIQGLVWHWIALALFILACVTDWFDGYVARRLDHKEPARGGSAGPMSYEIGSSDDPDWSETDPDALT